MKWVERFESHAVHEAIKTTLMTISESGISQTNMDVIEQYQRIDQVLTYTLRCLNNCDPVMVPISSLNNLYNSISTINSEVNAFINNGNTGHLSNADSYVDSVLTYLSELNRNSILNDVEGVRESISSFRKSIGQYIRHIEDGYRKIETLKTEIEPSVKDLSITIENQKSRLDNAISQFQSQFSSAEESRKNQFYQEEEKRKEKYLEVTEQRENEFESNINNFKLDYESIVKRLTKSGEDFDKNSKDRFQEYIVELERIKAYAEQLIHVIANTGMAGGYQKVANEEKKSASTWRMVSVAALVGLIIFAMATFFSTLQSQFSWTHLIARFFVAGTFAVLFAYAAKQASEHKKVERVNRKVEMELATVDPYLVGLPEEKQQSIKVLLAEKLFGKEDTISTDKEQLSGNAIDILKMALETIQGTIKKG